MDWGVHIIGAYRTFKKLMDTGGAGTVIVFVVRLWNRRELMVMVIDLKLFHHIQGRRHTFQATWFHSYIIFNSLLYKQHNPEPETQRGIKIVGVFGWYYYWVWNEWFCILYVIVIVIVKNEENRE